MLDSRKYQDSFVRDLSRTVTPRTRAGITVETLRKLNDDDLAVSDRALEGPAI